MQAKTADSFHLLCIVLQRMNIRLSVAGRLVKEGMVAPGTMHLTEPGVEAECLFDGAYDALHLHISNDLILEYSNAYQRNSVGLPTGAALTYDTLIARLGKNLLAFGQLERNFWTIYVDCIGGAIVARLLALQAGAGSREVHGVWELPKWRLKRALEYVDAHLAEPIRLGDMAAAAGLTPMYFAAQFRAATGLQPHQYLLRRRVECAQVLLSRDLPITDVADAVGFGSQSHLTSVFKRFVGRPPQKWCRSLAATSPQVSELRTLIA